jgi:ATP-dependent DNA helicase RecG
MAKLSDEVKYLKGVGPARAEVLAKRGIISVEDLIGYLPFRYEDRSHFSQIADVVPGNVYTLRVEVLEGQAIRYSRSSRSVYLLIVQDESLRRLH